MSRNFSRRQFLTTAAASTAASVIARPVIASASTNLFGSPGSFDLGISGDLLPWRDQGVINTSKSPYAKLHGVPVRAVTIEEGFWYKRRKTNVEKSIPTMREELEAHGRMNNFRRLGFIDYNGHLEVHSSLLSVVLNEQPNTVDPSPMTSA